MDITKEREIKVFDRGAWESRRDPLVIETTMQIVLNGVELVNIACSPQDTIQLAIGYLLSEGYVKSPADISFIDADDPCCIKIKSSASLDLSSNSIRINSCLGRGRMHEELVPLDAGGKSVSYASAHVLNIINELDASSQTFKQTGGVHSAGLADNQQLLFRFEDIGRHNAVDKVIGQAFLQQIDLSDKCLLLSGRIAAEILIKAARNGIPFILSRSAPTLKAVEKAEEIGLTVIGFARGQRFNLYCQGEGISFV
ncbi:MAG: formate dehydrogenase accessory sulfurtransferase FdhD [Syntrophomonadaceae bacterium]|jgi:FdhD protein|nr:formate dehydrogenase accessory sulfurtransferase FdhD [Syntrophomonadaceae bacterium]